MINLIKPNREWKEIAVLYGGSFKKGNLFFPAKMEVEFDDLRFFLRADFTSDNTWRSITVVSCDYQYNSQFKLKISDNWLKIDRRNKINIKISNAHLDIKKEIEELVILPKLLNIINDFNIDFNQNGKILPNYDVLPTLTFKTRGYIINHEYFRVVFRTMQDISTILIKHKIVKAAPNK